MHGGFDTLLTSFSPDTYKMTLIRTNSTDCFTVIQANNLVGNEDKKFSTEISSLQSFCGSQLVMDVLVKSNHCRFNELINCSCCDGCVHFMALCASNPSFFSAGTWIISQVLHCIDQDVWSIIQHEWEENLTSHHFNDNTNGSVFTHLIWLILCLQTCLTRLFFYYQVSSEGFRSKLLDTGKTTI